jgi:Cu+-exporting ATPase
VAAHPGQGIEGKVQGGALMLGTPTWMAARGLAVDTQLVARLAAEGKTVVVLADHAHVLGYLGIADRLRTSSANAVSRLQTAGVEVVMLTGDNTATAQAVAGQAGITRWKAGVLPQDKAAEVQRLQAQGKFVGMAGDGINDAPALAAADVGIAMATGSDVAIESAGITLLGGDLRGLSRARRLSRGTMRNIRQNLVFAFAYNLLGVPIAAGVLYPVFGLLLSPMIASAAMSFSSVSVIGNSLRLRRLPL